MKPCPFCGETPDENNDAVFVMASMMLTAGESPVWLAQQMGHSDFTMIARIYQAELDDGIHNR